MIRYFTFEEIDELAETLVRKYIKDKGLKNVWCIDAEGIAKEMLGCNIEYAQFAEDDPNKTAFISDGKTPLTICEGGEIKQAIYPASTIVIDMPLMADRNSAHARFSIMHEGGHKIQEMLCPSLVRACFESRFDSEYGYKKEDFERLLGVSEMYANRFAAAALMPEFLLRKTLKAYNDGKYLRLYGSHLMKEEDKIILNKMANRMGVSPTALFNRFRSLKMFEYRDAEEFIGQLTVPPEIYNDKEQINE